MPGGGATVRAVRFTATFGASGGGVAGDEDGATRDLPPAAWAPAGAP